jgi:hypothetical protein
MAARPITGAESMFDQNTFDSRYSGGAGDDPIIGLIAEYFRKDEIAFDARRRADKALYALPDDVRNRQPRILIGHHSSDAGDTLELHATSVPDIDSYFRPPSQVLQNVRRILGIVYTLKAGRDELVAELRAECDRIDAAYENSGHAALDEEADALQEQGAAVFDQIEETPPVTLAGADALLRLHCRACGPIDDDDPILGNVLTWLRAVAAALTGEALGDVAGDPPAPALLGDDPVAAMWAECRRLYAEGSLADKAHNRKRTGELDEQRFGIEEKICRARATTISGVLAQFAIFEDAADLSRSEQHVALADNIKAAIRDMQAREAQP